MHNKRPRDDTQQIFPSTKRIKTSEQVRLKRLDQSFKDQEEESTNQQRQLITMTTQTSLKAQQLTQIMIEEKQKQRVAQLGQYQKWHQFQPEKKKLSKQALEKKEIEDFLFKQQQMENEQIEQQRQQLNAYQPTQLNLATQTLLTKQAIQSKHAKREARLQHLLIPKPVVESQNQQKEQPRRQYTKEQIEQYRHWLQQQSLQPPIILQQQQKVSNQHQQEDLHQTQEQQSLQIFPTEEKVVDQTQVEEKIHAEYTSNLQAFSILKEIDSPFDFEETNDNLLDDLYNNDPFKDPYRL